MSEYNVQDTTVRRGVPVGTWSVGAFEGEFHLLPLSHHLLPSREVAPMSSD